MVEYLAYKLCKQYKPNNVNLNIDHPFGTSGYGAKTRDNMLKIKDLYNLTFNLTSYFYHNSFDIDYSKEVKKWLKDESKFNAYEEFYKYINDVLSLKDDILKCHMYHGGREHFLKFFNELENAKKLALEYQCKYGSTDNDKNEKLYYDNIITNSLCLYEK